MQELFANQRSIKCNRHIVCIFLRWCTLNYKMVACTWILVDNLRKWMSLPKSWMRDQCLVTHLQFAFAQCQMPRWHQVPMSKCQDRRSPAVELLDVGHVGHPGPGHDHLLGEAHHVDVVVVQADVGPVAWQPQPPQADGQRLSAAGAPACCWLDVVDLQARGDAERKRP